MRVTALVAALVLAVGFAACGQSTPTATPEPANTPDTPASMETELPEVATPTPMGMAQPEPTGTPVATTVAEEAPAAEAPEPTPTQPAGPPPTATPVPPPTSTPTPAPTPTMTPTPTRVASTDPGALPPFPNTYKGQVFVGGSPAPYGILVFARILGYQTPSFTVDDSRYVLVIGPPSVSYFGQLITFHANIDGVEVQASEIAVYDEANLTTQENLLTTLHLHFP